MVGQLTRYATAYWAEDDCGPSDYRLSIDVYETRGPVFTGIVTAAGARIMRQLDTVPMGFHPREPVEA